MLILIILAVATFVLGLIFIAGQDKLKELDALMNKTIGNATAKKLSKKMDKIVGLLLVGFGVVLFIVALSLKK